MLNWQNVLTLVVVVGAAAYLLLLAWRSFRSRDGCPTCTGCASAGAPATTLSGSGETPRDGRQLPIVPLEAVHARASDKPGRQATATGPELPASKSATNAD